MCFEIKIKYNKTDDEPTGTNKQIINLFSICNYCAFISMQEKSSGSAVFQAKNNNIQNEEEDGTRNHCRNGRI